MEHKNAAHPAFKGAAWMITFRIFSRLIGVASTLVLARLLNTADFGIVAVAFTISAAFNSISNVGLTENLVRYPDLSRDVLDTAFSIQVMKGLLTCVLLFVAAPHIASWFSDPRLENVIYVFSAGFLLGGFDNVGIVEFRRSIRFDKEFKLSAVERISTFAVTITVAIICRNYWALVVGTVISKLVRLVTTYVVHPYRPRLSLRAWRELAGISLWMWLSSLVYIVWLRADPLVVGSSVSSAQLGIYVVALDIALLPVSEIMEPIGAVLFASFAAERNAGRDPRTNAFSLAVSLMSIIAPIALVVSAASTDVVGVLLGSKWGAAAPIVAILAISAMLSPFSSVAAQVLTATGKIKSNLAVVASASLVKLLFLYVSSISGDLWKIALASLLITSAESALFIAVLRRNGSRMDGIWWPVARIIVSLGLSAVALNLTGIAWAGDTPASIVWCIVRGTILVCVGLGVYVTALFALWVAGGRPEGPEHQTGRVIQKLSRGAFDRVQQVLKLWFRRSS